MRVISPKAEAAARAKIEAHRAAILAFIEANNKPGIDFADIRAGMTVEA